MRSAAIATLALAVSSTLLPSPVIVAVSDRVPLVIRGWSTVTVFVKVTDPLFVAVNCQPTGPVVDAPAT